MRDGVVALGGRIVESLELGHLGRLKFYRPGSTGKVQGLWGFQFD